MYVGVCMCVGAVREVEGGTVGVVEDVRMREEHRMERGPDQAQGS